MLYLSSFELYSRWVPLWYPYHSRSRNLWERVLYLWIDVVFSRQKSKGTEPLCSIILSRVSGTSAFDGNKVYVYYCFLKRSIEICFDRRVEKCTRIACRSTGGKLVSSAQFRTIESDKHHRRSCSLGVLEIMSRCLQPWIFNDAGQFEYCTVAICNNHRTL